MKKLDKTQHLLNALSCPVQLQESWQILKLIKKCPLEVQEHNLSEFCCSLLTCKAHNGNILLHYETKLTEHKARLIGSTINNIMQCFEDVILTCHSVNKADHLHFTSSNKGSSSITSFLLQSTILFFISCSNVHLSTSRLVEVFR